MDKPIADSAAATTKTIKAKNWPQIESKEREVQMRIKLIANNNNSIDINKVNKFFLLTTIPKIPIKNKIK